MGKPYLKKIKRKFCRDLIAKIIFIYPFLFILGLIDFVINLIIPYKYEDPKLPRKKAVLAELSDKEDPTSPYRSTLFDDLTVKDDDNIYNEFVKSVYKYANFNTLGVR